MTLDANRKVSPVAIRYILRLREELGVTTRSNAWLREQLNFKDQSLRACRAAEGVLKKRNDKLEQDLSWAEEDIAVLKQTLARKDACLRRVGERVERIKLLLEQNKP